MAMDQKALEVKFYSCRYCCELRGWGEGTYF